MVQHLEITPGRQVQEPRVEPTCGGQHCSSLSAWAVTLSLCLSYSFVSMAPLYPRPCLPPHQFQGEEKKWQGSWANRRGRAGGRSLCHLHWIRGHWMQDDLGRPGWRLRHRHHIWEPKIRQSEANVRSTTTPQSPIPGRCWQSGTSHQTSSPWGWPIPSLPSPATCT